MTGDSRAFHFCQRWLVWANVFFAVFGVVIAVAGDTILFAIWNNAATDAFFAGTFPPEILEFKRFLFGIIGGTIAGFHVLMAYVAAVPLARREAWAIRALAAALLVWFAIDSAIGLLTGGWFNVVLINLFALIAVGVPLLVARRAIDRSG
jgi:hypothetical protein